MKKPNPQTQSGFAEEAGAPYGADKPARRSFLHTLTSEQIAELEAAIAEVERGEVVEGDEVFRSLAAKYKLDLE